MARMKRFNQCPISAPCDTAPHFVIGARPLAVPADLCKLSDGTRVSYESGIKRLAGVSATTAGQLRQLITETIARQREGYFTLDETAQILADSRTVVDPVAAVERFHKAHQTGNLTIRQGGTRFPKGVCESISDFHDLLEATEIDRWLRKAGKFGFIEAAPTIDSPAAVATSSGKVHSTKGTGRRDVLWPAIEKAQAACQDPKDTADVWGQLGRLAESEVPPLLAVTKTGIKWMRDGEKVAILTRDALDKRLHPEKRKRR